MQEKELILFSPQVEIFTPFAGSVDPSRLNMAAKQQLQCVVSKKTDTPLIIDKNFKKMTEMNSPFAEFADYDGHVLTSDFETIIIYYPESKKLITKSVPPFRKLVNNAISLKYRVKVGPIKKGELLFDYTNMDIETHMPKIGYRANILFSSFFGYTSDDAMVISESFAKRAEIEYIQKIFVPITKEWKYMINDLNQYFYRDGQIQNLEAYTQYFNIDTSEHFMSEIHNISEQQTMFFTKNVPGIEGGEIVSTKVHLNTTKSFEELKDEYIYTPGMIKEIETLYKDNYKVYLNTKHIFSQLGLPKEKNKELSEELFHNHYSTPKFVKNFEEKIKNDFNLDPNNVDFLLEVTIQKTMKTTRGDKFTNLFAGKGVVSMIIPDELMPKDPVTLEPIDIIFNPLGIFGRNNWGSVFELALSKIIKDIEMDAKDPINLPTILTKIKRINELFISKFDQQYSDDIDLLIKKIESDIANGDLESSKKLIQDIKEKGFYIFIPNFPKIPYNQFYKEFLNPYAEEFKVNFRKQKVGYSRELISWLREKWHYKNEVFGSDSYDIDIEAFLGHNYMLKLYHTAHSKYTSVSLANSYSKITGQPVRGRKKLGGQHISWQTLAALLGHKENNGMLKELYSIKSDAPVKDKEKFLIQYITHGEYKMKPKYTSLTKRAIDNALKILGMQFEN
jgi:DNA-directed RNA polymerase beta subunit